MDAGNQVHIGFLSSYSANRPHFDVLQSLVPQDVTLTIEGLDLRRDLPREGRADEVVRRAAAMVRRTNVQGLIVPGAPLVIANPEVETRLAAELKIPVSTAIHATTAALRSIGARKLILMTPFDDETNARLENLLKSRGFAVLSCPSLGYLRAVSDEPVEPEQIFRIVETTVGQTQGADTIYFQGAPFDPLPVIERIETRSGLPVVASSPAMLWHLLSLLRRKYSISGYGRLLELWPALT